MDMEEKGRHSWRITCGRRKEKEQAKNRKGE